MGAIPRTVAAATARSVVPLLLVAAMATAVSALRWRTSSDAVWAAGCDWSSKGDIGRASTTGEACSGACGRTAGCTHFTWSTYTGTGTCYFKGGHVSLSDAFPTSVPGAVCGLMRRQSGGGGGSAPAPPPSGGGGNKRVNEWVVALINAERRRYGMASQRASTRLTASAIAHSRTQAAAGRIFHQDVGALMRAWGAARAAENVASRSSGMGSARSLATALVGQWMASPGHRKNILTAEYNWTGCGVVRGGSKGHYYATCVYAQFK